ncbi:MAG: hypothetical protein WKF59_09015 [Chitinophagaceae bacterium]
MPYNKLDEAIDLSKKGKGSLCSSIVTADTRICKRICDWCRHTSWKNISIK